MKDGYTHFMTEKINDWGLDKIYEMEDDIYGLEERVPEIIDYLKDIHFSMPLGLALRRYICERYSEGFDEEKQCYSFALPEKVILTRNYIREDYDIETDDIAEYIEIFNYINARYNTDASGRLTLDIPKAEIRRQLRSTSGCIRKKLFDLSFALHMDSVYTAKFLTDVLAEQTYNYRDPKEIIALFCQSYEEYNSYQKYEELCQLFDARSASTPVSEPERENYTSFAESTVAQEIRTEEALMEFLLANRSNFYRYSHTAYNEFVSLYIKASSSQLSSEKKSELKSGSAEDHFSFVKEQIKNGNLMNPEQLARKMLACIPRATTKRIKDDRKIVSDDFINIYNGEGGQNSKKVKTTELPKRITMNLPVSDRLWDLMRRDKPVERKDLVFMKFYVFSLYLQEKDEYSAEDYFVFLDECNDLLVRCGMSRLYPGNRFENLIMLSLLASIPFEMFENIIEYSFMNEPGYEGAE
ncbi:MAG: hypothetical protein IKY78_10785 [Clostridia bacterium]|nr:hypothetical protein [Clostridia bacterium]